MRVGVCGMALLLGVACGKVERSAPLEDAGGASGSGGDAGVAAAPGSGGTAADVPSTATGGTAGTGTSSSGTMQPDSDDLSIDCEACERFTSYTFSYEAWVSAVAWAGERLLVVHSRSGDARVDLLDLEPEPHASWSWTWIARAPNNTHLFEHEGRAVVIDNYSEDHLDVFAESAVGLRDGRVLARDFTLVSPPIDGRTTPQRVGDGELHLLSSDAQSGAVDPGGARYQKGPLEGPFELVERFETPVVLPRQGPVVPITRQDDLNDATVLLSAELDGETREVELSSAFRIEALVAGDDLLALGQTPLGGAELVWSDDRRQLSDANPNTCFRSTNPYPLCPQSSRDLGERNEVLLRAQVFLDDMGEPWVAYLVADISERCVWVGSGICFEGLPCACVEQVLADATSTALVVERVANPASGVRVDLPIFQGNLDGVQLAARAANGVISVAAVDTESFRSVLYMVRFLAPP